MSKTGLCELETRMSLPVAKVKATDFLDDDGICVAYAGFLQVEDVAAPTEVGFLGEELRVESEGAVGHTVEVEQFVMHGKDFPEVGLPKNKSKNVYQFKIFY